MGAAAAVVVVVVVVVVVIVVVRGQHVRSHGPSLQESKYLRIVLARQFVFPAVSVRTVPTRTHS